jgi:site-specific recombinase XerD
VDVEAEHAGILRRMDEDLVLRGLSENTRESYQTHARLFLAFCGGPVDALGTEDIRRFLTFLLTEEHLSPATVNVYSAALRFLFAVTLNYLQILRAKYHKALSPVLSRADVAALLAAATDVKHRALLCTIYGSGLCVSEAAALHTADIDSTAMRVFVSGGKGNKDRYTLLAQTALLALRAYRPHHAAGWLFPGSSAYYGE